MAEEKKMIIDGVSCPFTTERNVLEVARNNGIDTLTALRPAAA